MVAKNGLWQKILHRRFRLATPGPKYAKTESHFLEVFKQSQKLIFIGPTFFAKLIFFPPKLFFGILEKEDLSEQKNFWREKNQLGKNHFPIFIL
jgi:hypothetical protein